MPMVGSGNNRGGDMPGSYTYVSKYTTKDKYIELYGVFEGEKQFDDISKFGNMKFAYRNREFWCKGYYVDTVGKNTKAIKDYISDQLKRDRESDQLSLFDPRDPFMGSK